MQIWMVGGKGRQQQENLPRRQNATNLILIIGLVVK